MIVRNVRRISATHDAHKKCFIAKNVYYYKLFVGDKYTSSSALPDAHTYIFQKYCECIILQLFSCNTLVCDKTMFSVHKII
jgi:hypothetical protein